MLHRALARFTSNTAVKMAVVGEAMKTESNSKRPGDLKKFEVKQIQFDFLLQCATAFKMQIVITTA